MKMTEMKETLLEPDDLADEIRCNLADYIEDQVGAGDYKTMEFDRYIDRLIKELQKVKGHYFFDNYD